MQPTMYYQPNQKPTYYPASHRPEMNTINPIHKVILPTSPRTNIEPYRFEERPQSHNLSLNSPKHIHQQSPNESKLFPLDNVMKPLKSFTQKNVNHPNQQAPFFNRYGDMKGSYIGPDARELAYIKDRQAINQNFKAVRRIPRASEPSINSQIQTNSSIKSTEDSPQVLAINKRKSQDEPAQNINSVAYKKLDPIQRAKMRKSSLDPTEGWMKPAFRKKAQRKITLNDFEKINELGTGKYGKVFLVKEKQTQFICALKIIEKQMLKDQQITEQFIRQLKIQLFLNHPNIIKLYGYFEDSMNIYIILEVALGGQLYKQLKKGNLMGEPRVAVIMRQVVSAVNELHSNQIIHRDIKPQNIVLNQNIVKLCDFGWSVYHGQTLRSTFCGTPLYVSPEILKGNNYDQKIDIWSLGIMMYEMLTGQNPFKITQEQELIKIIKDAVTFPSYANVSNEAKDFVMCCLQKNPTDRKNIRELMNHEFFKKYPEKTSDRKVAPV